MGVGAWEGIPPSGEMLLIAVPHTGLVSFEWAVGLKILQPPVPFSIISNRGLPIDRARCDLVEQAQKMNASHIFFLDSDVILTKPHALSTYIKKLDEGTELIFNFDRSMASTTAKNDCVSAGFLVFRPSLETYNFFIGML